MTEPERSYPQPRQSGHFNVPAARGDALRAFTLIELMVVLVLIGIMAAVIIPEMKGSYEEALLRSSSRQLIDAVSLASSRAVSLNQRHQLRIDKQTGRYAVETRARDGEGAGMSRTDTPGGEGKIDPRITVEIVPAEDSSDVAESVSNENATPRRDVIAFYPDGTADGVDIVLRDREGFRLGLRINPVTARIHATKLERQ